MDCEFLGGRSSESSVLSTAKVCGRLGVKNMVWTLMLYFWNLNLITTMVILDNIVSLSFSFHYIEKGQE